MVTILKQTIILLPHIFNLRGYLNTESLSTFIIRKKDEVTESLSFSVQ